MGRNRTVFRMKLSDDDQAHLDWLCKYYHFESSSELLSFGLNVLDLIAGQFQNGNSMMFVERSEDELQEDVIREFNEMMKRGDQS